MSTGNDVFSVAIKEAGDVLVHAQGDPAKVLVYGMAAAGIVAAGLLSWGHYKLKEKFGYLEAWDGGSVEEEEKKIKH